MKKFYALLTLLGLFFFAATPAVAQEEVDEVTISVSMAGGDWVEWNGSAISPWARTWNSNSTPAISVCCKQGGNSTTDIRGNNFSGANNMSVWGSAKSDLMFYTNYGTYEIMVEEGWYIASVEFDFNCANNNNQNDGSLGVTLGENDEVISSAKDDNQHVEWTNEDEEIYSVQFIVSRKEGSYNFARTSNFKVTVKRLEAITQALQAMEAAIAKYEPYTQDGSSPLKFGTNPGDYTKESVLAFEEAFVALIEGVDNAEDPTPEFIYGLIASLDAAYEAVLNSKVPLNLADGYYRFRTGINYNDGNAKYMYVEPGTETISGMWGTVDVANARSLWKLTKVETKDGEDIFDFVSVATDARFNDNPSTLSEASEWRFVLEPVLTSEVGETYVQIKYADRDPGTYNRIYVHQAGHNSGAGTGGNLTIWSPTYPTTLEASLNMGASEWVILPVSDKEAQTIIDAYAGIKEKEEMKKNYQQILTDSKANLEIAKDNPTITVDEETKLIVENSQFSSPWSDASEGSLDNLLDGDPATFWHSDWHNAPQASHTHYLDVALNKPTHDLVAMTIARRKGAGSAHVTQWSAYGSNTPDIYYTQEEIDAAQDGDDAYGKTTKDVKTSGQWHKLADLYTPFQNNTETKTTQPFDTKGYQYLRFYIDATTNAGTYFTHLGEFQLNPATVEIAANSQYKVMGALVTNLEQVLSDQIELELDNLTKEQYNALKTAYDAFMEKFVDPSDLRAAIKTAEVSTAGIVVGTNPGEWGPDTDAGALATTVTNAKAYDASGDYTPAQSATYIENLQALSGDILASANKIQEGKWYRIHFGSKETFEANEWDIENNDDQIVAEEYVINESLWDKYITVAKRTTEEVTYYEEVDDGNGGTTSEERKATKNLVTPYDEDEVIARGAALYFDADGDIEDKDLSLFRFINVGDSAYALQNKATGLFLRAENTTLDVIPSLFNVSAIGYGQNLIAASNIITGKSQSNLHFQRAQNRVVTYGENTVGSRSALYIEEVEDVASDYDGTDFFMELKTGSMHAFCFPVDLQPVEDEESGHEYVFYDVISVANGVVKLNTIQEANAGRPFVFIVDGTYVEEQEKDTIPVAFKHGYEFTDKAIGTSLLKGTYNTVTELDKGVIAVQPGGFVVNKSNISAMGGLTVSAYSAYVAGEEAFPLDVAYTYEIDEIADGIEATLKTVAKTGAIYTIDGRLVSKSGNLNTLRRLGKGTYILNGTKVVVK